MTCRIWILTVLLTISGNSYDITFDPGMDEVHLIIWSDSNTDDPWLQVESVEVSHDQTQVSLPRHPLPPGSYVLQAVPYVWTGCPDMCSLKELTGSPTVIIKVPVKEESN